MPSQMFLGIAGGYIHLDSLVVGTTPDVMPPLIPPVSMATARRSVILQVPLATLSAPLCPCVSGREICLTCAASFLGLAMPQANVFKPLGQLMEQLSQPSHAPYVLTTREGVA